MPTLIANVVNLFDATITPASLVYQHGTITSLNHLPLGTPTGTSIAPTTYLLPGFIDAHVHIESSMLLPSEFARLATPQGTVATVSDPHEIANVLGTAGIRYMHANGAQTPFKFHWGAPSCVPATAFETAGASISATEIADLFDAGICHYLSEVMNFPAVLARDPAIMAKLLAAHSRHKPIDGHAPNMRGDAVPRYFHPDTQITTDHECTRLEEALEKIAAGCHILIREGSAAKNFDALWPLLNSHPDRIMLCSDDKHPDDLLLGHINQLATRALHLGVPLFNVLRAACLNPVLHYRVPVGLLRVGDPADFVETDSLTDFTAPHILRTFINGEVVADHGQSHIPRHPANPLNQFHAVPLFPSDLALRATGAHIRIIEVDDGQLLTRSSVEAALVAEGQLVADPSRDILKMAVLNRYAPSKPAVAFIRGFGLKHGAIASSVAHDSHNIVAVGTSDTLLAKAINAVIRHEGGLAVVSETHEESLPLNVAGLLSTSAGEHVAARYSALQHMAKEVLHSRLKSPFMTLSFMALLVIPSLKLSDKGLFDGTTFRFTPVCV